MTSIVKPDGIDRRTLLSAGTGAVFVSLISGHANAAPEDVLAAQRKLFGDRPIREGRVSLKLPPIAENGFSVPLTVNVESPMTDADHVTRIAVFSPRNPLPNVAQFTLGPRAGLASVSTRIRLGGTQAILAVAEMNDGTLWSGSAETVVTLAACVVL